MSAAATNRWCWHSVSAACDSVRPRRFECPTSIFCDAVLNCAATPSKWAVGSLKNHKTRSVALPAFVMDELARTCAGKDRNELLWPSPRGGYMSGPSLWKTSWLAMAVGRCRKADPTFPRVTPHDLRHTAASLAICAGANPEVVQRMLGHASAAMTLDVYADLFESDLESVAENVAKLWPRVGKPHTRSTPESAS
jgi:integrase